MSREVKMTTDTEWYLAMGEAVKARNRALSMAENWQDKVLIAEDRILRLSQEGPKTLNTETPTEQVQEQ
jgi:hypothetical protein